MQLTIQNLSKTYPNGVRALHDVNLILTNGMFGLLGRSNWMILTSSGKKRVFGKCLAICPRNSVSIPASQHWT